MSYIIEQDSSERESVATHRLLATMPLRAQLFHGVSWFIMELRFSTLGLDEAGEIDIIGGRLTFSDSDAYRSVYTEEAAQWPEAAPGFVEMMATRRFAQDGGLAWPPPMDLLVGVEVKCSYENEGVIKSAKDSRDKLRDLHKQLRRDVALGLDIVSFLDIIANQPATGKDSDAWWNASSKAFATLDAADPILAKRIPAGLPVGHWVWSVGAVAGGHEGIRGAGGPICVRRPSANPHTPKRVRVEELLIQLLSVLPRPRTPLVLLKDCKTCQRIHPFAEGSEPGDGCLSEGTHSGVVFPAVWPSR
jgi:hypothetical protein